MDGERVCDDIWNTAYFGSKETGSLLEHTVEA